MNKIKSQRRLSRKKLLEVYTSSNCYQPTLCLKMQDILWDAYEKRDFDSLFMHIGRTGRFPLFLDIHEELDDINYFKILGRVLTAETYSSKEKEIIWYLVSNPKRDKTLRIELMYDEEKQVYKNLPETGIIYRGSRHEMTSGFSWTLDRDKAIFFAKRHPEGGAVFKGKYIKPNVIAFFSSESEIFIHPTHVIDQKVDERVEPLEGARSLESQHLMYTDASNHMRKRPAYIQIQKKASLFWNESFLHEACQR